MCILCECPAPTCMFVCKCERGRELCATEGYWIIPILLLSFLFSSFFVFLFSRLYQATVRRSNENEKTIKIEHTEQCVRQWNYIILISVHHLSCVLCFCFVLFLLHPVKWMYSNRNVVIQWIKYVLCLIFMPFIHWHIHDIQTLHYFVALICHIRYIYVYFILFSVYRWLSFGPMCFFSCFSLLSLSLFFSFTFPCCWFRFCFRSVHWFNWCGKQYMWYGNMDPFHRQNQQWMVCAGQLQSKNRELNLYLYILCGNQTKKRPITMDLVATAEQIFFSFFKSLNGTRTRFSFFYAFIRFWCCFSIIITIIIAIILLLHLFLQCTALSTTLCS